ncbi:polysaccharide polymerase [Oenococcus oeni]
MLIEKQLNQDLENRENEFITKSFSIIAIVISISAMLQGLGIIGDNILNGVQALIVLIIYLRISSFKKFNILYLTAIFFSFVIALINLAPYMFSASMMLMIMAILDQNYDIDYRRILLVYVKSCAIVFSVIVIAYYAFNFNNHDVTMWRIDKIIYRKSIGFDQPNVAMMEFLGITFGIFGLITDKKRKLSLILLAIITGIIYTQTVSRTSTILIILSIFLLFILGKKADNFMPKFLSKIVSLTPIFLMGISLYILLHPYSDTLNTILSGRLALYQEYYQTYGVHLLGTHNLENAMFDSGYLQSLLSKGILFASQLMLILTWMGWRLKSMSWKSAILLLAYFSLGFTETALQHFELFFPIVIILGNDIGKYKNEKNLF